jgi:hypothetical protein
MKMMLAKIGASLSKASQPGTDEIMAEHTVARAAACFS